jgi:hypothetical protein
MFTGKYTSYIIRIKQDKWKRNSILGFQIIILYSTVSRLLDGMAWLAVISMHISVNMQILTFIQNVELALMVSIVSLAVIHVSTESVTNLTEIVHMVVLRVLKKIAVILQV